MIALYADENVDRRIVEGLRRRWIAVLTAREVGLTGRVPDERHLELASERALVLLTGDQDLLSVSHTWTSGHRVHAGLIYYHPRWTSVGTVVRDVGARARSLEPDQARGQIFYVPRDRR